MESSVHGSGRGMRRKSEFLYSDVKSPKRRNEGPMEDKTQEDVKEDFQRKQVGVVALNLSALTRHPLVYSDYCSFRMPALGTLLITVKMLTKSFAQAWLTFGAYTEELPPAKEQIKNQVLWKMASTSGMLCPKYAGLLRESRKAT